MTNAELTVLLETLAKLVEATAKDAEDATRIIWEAIPNKLKIPHENALAKPLMRNTGSEGAGSLARRPPG